jgi:hypothetical protein
VLLLILNYVIDLIKALLRRLYALRARGSLKTKKKLLKKKEYLTKNKQNEVSEADNQFFLIPRE